MHLLAASPYGALGTALYRGKRKKMAAHGPPSCSPVMHSRSSEACDLEEQNSITGRKRHVIGGCRPRPQVDPGVESDGIPRSAPCAYCCACSSRPDPSRVEHTRPRASTSVVSAPMVAAHTAKVGNPVDRGEHGQDHNGAGGRGTVRAL